MDFETRELVEKILELTEENNKILRKMRRGIFWGRVFHVIYWVIIIGISIGAYYYIQPLIENMLQLFGTTKDGLQNLEKFTEAIRNLPGPDGFPQ